MVCTFGDLTDVMWWRELGLPVRSVLGPDGRLAEVPWGAPGWESEDLERRTRRLRGAAGQDDQPGAPANRRAAAGVRRARRRAHTGHAGREVLREGRAAGRDRDQPPVVHPHGRPSRRADRARPGAPLASAVHARAVRGLGERSDRRLVHQPPALLRGAVPRLVPARRERRRTVRPADLPQTGAASRRSLDRRARRISRPSSAGSRTASLRRPGRDGHVGHLLAHAPDRGRGGRGRRTCSRSVFPMDVRPQAHDIIRTWLFSTILRSHLDQDVLPWRNAAISGWVLDPDRKKMSKSKGNVVTPDAPARGVRRRRRCATGRRAGARATDTAFDAQQMKVGRRLAVKLLERVEVRTRRPARARARR